MTQQDDDRPVTDVRPQAPAPVLKDYPPEASPHPDDDSVPVEVPGEQADPEGRATVFPEDVDRDG